MGAYICNIDGHPHALLLDICAHLHVHRHKCIKF